MDEDSTRRVEIERIGLHKFRATNVRGGTLTFGDGGDSDFGPVELLLTAIAGCTGLDVEYISEKRAEPDSFDITVRADKVRDDTGNRLTEIVVVLSPVFPSGEGGDAAREILPSAVRRSHDRLCTVSRTVELGTQVAVELT
jgi:uncharacterized OsmC-like protein